MEISEILKVVGGLMSGVGSLLLAWRAKKIFEWVKYAIAAHEVTLDTTTSTVFGHPRKYNGGLIFGAAENLIDIEAKLGFWLFVLGMIFFGLGMISTALSYFF